MGDRTKKHLEEMRIRASTKLYSPTPWPKCKCGADAVIEIVDDNRSVNHFCAEHNPELPSV